MGTRLYDKGVYINRSYDELNLTAPDLVREVHEEYVAAGADIIETNTFGATRHKLQPYGLESKLREINIAAVKLAREAAGDKVYVAGAIGPLGLRLEPFGPTSFEEAREMYKEQVAALLEGGVDLFILETFSELPLIEQAIRAVRELTDLPIVAQMTIQMDGKTLYGDTPEHFTQKLDELGVDVIGLNCGMGPNHLLNALEKMRAVTAKPLSAQPNAGLPRDVQGRQFYMGSPGIHGGIFPPFRPGRCQIRRRVLRNDADAHKTHRRRHPLDQPEGYCPGRPKKRGRNRFGAKAGRRPRRRSHRAFTLVG